ncbi:MAG: hypothetical protein K2M94_05360 [Paramuribaculum sp.]|nr:hypothetical protein [Paramuribaculum sp.]
MEKSLKQLLQKMGIVSILIWGMIIISGCIFIIEWRGFDYTQDMESSGITLIIISGLNFFLSLGISIYGFITALKLNKQLVAEKIKGGKFIIFSTGLMLLSTIMSVQSISGINIPLAVLVVEGVGISSFAGYLCLIATFLFMISIVLCYIGISEIASGERNKHAAIHGLANVRNSSLTLMIVSFVFSPLLITYIDANAQKFESTVVFNIVLGLAYLGAFAYYIISCRNVKDITVVKPENISYTSIDSEFKCLLDKIGKSYLYAWSAIIVSLIIFIIFIFVETKSTVLAILSLIPYIAGCGVVIFGLFYSINLTSKLKGIGKLGGKFIIASFITLGVICFLSFNSPFGGNITLMGYLNDNSISEFFSELTEFDEPLSVYTGALSLVLFVLFPIFTLTGVGMLYNIIPGLKRSTIGSVILLFSSIVFAPIFIIVFTEEDIDEIFIYLFLALCSYIIGVYFLNKDWKKCDKIEDNFLTNTSIENCDGKIFSSETIKKMKKLVIKDKRLLCATIIISIGILWSVISVFSYTYKQFNRHGKKSTVENNLEIPDYSEYNREDILEVTRAGIDDEIETIKNENERHKRNYSIIHKLYSIVFYNPNSGIKEADINAFEKQYFSNDVIERLKVLNPYDDGVWYGAFRTEAQDGDGESRIRVITPRNDSWYDVEYFDMGFKGETAIQIENGKIVDFMPNY